MKASEVGPTYEVRLNFEDANKKWVGGGGATASVR